MNEHNLRQAAFEIVLQELREQRDNINRIIHTMDAVKSSNFQEHVAKLVRDSGTKPEANPSPAPQESRHE